MVGVTPQDQPCAFCHRPVNEVDATWYEGRPFHEHHFKLFLANELSQYEKKKSLGTLTFAEASRMMDYQDMYDKERKSPASIKLSKYVFSDTPRFHGNTQLSLSHMPKKPILPGSTQYKELTESHNENKSRKLTLISDGKPENLQTPHTPQK